MRSRKLRIATDWFSIGVLNTEGAEKTLRIHRDSPCPLRLLCV